ncbi:MAG: 4'-phosphopantetheinyl transferase family protein [Desulfuromonadaceae bacterium]
MKAAPRPLDGEVHLYCLTLPDAAAELTRFERLLSATELERAFLLKSDLARNRYIAGRGKLRDILGGYLNIDPAEVRIATGEQGKPFLADAAVDLRFNLSHVDDLLLLAIAAGVEVGVDIERVAADKPVHDMARLVFSRREQEELLAMPVPEQIQAFYRCWVRKEACLKACGRGFSLPGSSFDVPLRFEESAMQTVNCNQSFWHVRDIDVPEKYCAAVAVEAGDVSSFSPTVVWWDDYNRQPEKALSQVPDQHLQNILPALADFLNN